MTTSNDTILLVGHGSREASGNAEILLFAERWRARHPDWRIEVGFIEFADPLLDPALNHAARNSERVLVLPLILNAAGHVRQDIPSAISAPGSVILMSSSSMPRTWPSAIRCCAS